MLLMDLNETKLEKTLLDIFYTITIYGQNIYELEKMAFYKCVTIHQKVCFAHKLQRFLPRILQWFTENPSITVVNIIYTYIRTFVCRFGIMLFTMYVSHVSCLVTMSYGCVTRCYTSKSKRNINYMYLV
jgi:hypothetical protein